MFSTENDPDTLQALDESDITWVKLWRKGKIVFNLKRFWKVNGKTVNLYEEIKAGRKTSEWRDATKYWIRRLTPRLQLTFFMYAHVSPQQPVDLTSELSEPKRTHTVDKAWFVVGYPKANLPRLEADITRLLYHQESNQFEIQFQNVKEIIASR